MVTLLLVLLILGLFGGGTFYNNGAYGNYGYSFGGVLLLILLFLVFTHRLGF